MLARSATASTVLGYVSLVAWLGAQFPQLIENARRQSVDGLALPFLANWFLGDATNLIGCVLTDQLPFQTMVATYFCFVDLCLLGQYIYYSRIQLAAHSLESPPDESPFTTPTGSIATITSASRRRRRSVSEISQLSTLHQISVAAAANAGLHSRDIEVVQMDSPTSYHHPRSLSQSTVLRIHPQEYDEQYAGSRVTSPVSPTSPSTASTDATTDHHFPAQQNSTGHGETEARSRTSGTSAQRNKRNVSWDPEFTTLSRRYGTASRDTKADSVPRHREPLPQTSAEEFWSGILPPPQPQPEVDLERGRRRARELHNLSLQVRPVQKTAVGPVSDEEAQLSEIEPLAHYPPAPRRSQSPIASVRRKSKYRATAPMVLFSIWLLVSFGGSSTQGSGSLQRPRSPPGAVLRRSPPLYPIPQDSPTPSSFSSNFPTPSFSLLSSSESSTFAVSELKINYDHPKEQFRDPEPQVRRIIGRVSAWICTTLYLTSRLPQIWKNYTRQSVEGLTMSLFVCAFLGNCFYVASIMTNPVLDEPHPISDALLKESIPYLLGSGGTLLFDVTIVAQSFLYRGRKPLNPPISSASGYLPPRSVGMGGSLSASGITSRTSTMRSEQLRRTRGRSSSSMPFIGSTYLTSYRDGLGHARGNMPEREPLLSETMGIEVSTPPAMPRYRSTSTSEWPLTESPPVGGDIVSNN